MPARDRQGMPAGMIPAIPMDMTGKLWRVVASLSGRAEDRHVVDIRATQVHEHHRRGDARITGLIT
jgi:hypothetical protein